MRKEPFASIEDYEARYGEYGDDELLGSVLMDATRFICAELTRAGLDPDNEESADLYMQVCRSVAFRSLDHSDDDALGVPWGVMQLTQSSGPFSHTYQMANAHGDMYLTKAERRMLGLGRSRIRFIMPGGVGDD